MLRELGLAARGSLEQRVPIEDLDRTHDFLLAARMNRGHSRALTDPAGEILRAALMALLVGNDPPLAGFRE